MSWFCNKIGEACKYKTTTQQATSCEHWDPVNFLCDDKCRHCQDVDNIERARRQWLERSIRNKQAERKRIETPESASVFHRIKSGNEESDAKQAANRQRLEMMKRQTEAAERIAKALETLAGWFREEDDE